MPAPRRLALLGGLTPAAFLAAHWQRAPRLVRGAKPGFCGPFGRDDLFALAARDDVESRLVMRERNRYTLEHGPFRPRALGSLPPRRWTLLVQGTNLHDPRADALLREFAFVPYARLDDLMVSYAAPGGGVGPHVDAYDVFLLQGFGRRRWRYGAQRDLALRRGVPLAILERFSPTDDATLAPGDMLYLPPGVAHDGVAIDACTTYSIGFRAPSAQELAVAFLDHLRDRLALDGRYADPGRDAAREPARIDRAMHRALARMLDRIRWDDVVAARFVGAFLTEPKPLVHFEPPARPLSPAAWRGKAARCGVALDARTGLLYDDASLFINGEIAPLPRQGGAALRELANRRALSSRQCARLADAASALVYRWYRDGYLGLAR